MSKVILKGYEAIHYAERHGLAINKSAGPMDEANSGLTVNEAIKVANQDPALIWIEVDEAVNTADDPQAG
ncbi:MAG: hypothetical protein WAN46_03290 [Gammaproteobacteria bacterium]